ncbi:PglZ domain-containing protein [Candidatus Amarolinea dominans]|uniref:PglZ domain-containing protein n=1 Tax=Candidatus Amarolinea dominans TaxID=3140696 RepID=UPI0031359A55|nr:PglZ domain-containing protein [Anaerolineae bacterium]
MSILNRGTLVAPLLLWCDPDREWLELLRAVAGVGDFELWAEPDAPELLIRDRFYHTPRTPRVVWLPRSRDEITWFKVFELSAEAVWTKSLLQALREYGVAIARDQEDELVSLLPAHAREWLDQPKETWRELTPGHAKGTLVNDRRMLQVLTGEAGEFEHLHDEDRFAIFARRATEDFGLPDPAGMSEDAWRAAATARLLCTEAAEANPLDPPLEGDRIIPPGLSRDRALGLLRDWQANIHGIPAFERLTLKADATTSLGYWARHLAAMPRSYSSRAVEETLFKQVAETLDRIEEVDTLAQELANRAQAFRDRSAGFWGRLAAQRIGWTHLAQLADAASLLIENVHVETTWKTLPNAIRWYTARGWQLDLAGETLFEEQPDLPAQLHRIRARLRRGYLRATDRIGAAFSELLAHKDSAGVAGSLWQSLPTAGEAVLAILQAGGKGGATPPTALIFLDACRFDLGQRLAELLNSGEPTRRAEVTAALAPIPSITSLGMPFALPALRDALRVRLSPDHKAFQVSATSFEGDLALAEGRRRWLTAKWNVKEFLSIADVLDGDRLKQLGKLPKLIVVHGDEFDTAGHEGQLQLTGANEHLERYARAIRRLREAGFSRVVVATDHGFFHWQPERDEIEETKPGGELLWSSRRALVGRDLTHATAVRLPVPQSDLVALIPRSVNAFRTYGGLGYFHGGALLQELIIPVLVAQWPTKATKVSVVLKPVGQIANLSPAVAVQAGIGTTTLFGPDDRQLARLVRVKVQDPGTGKLVFKHREPVTVDPGGEAVAVQLERVESPPSLPRGSPLTVLVFDADDEEILAREDITLKVDIDEW